MGSLHDTSTTQWTDEPGTAPEAPARVGWKTAHPEQSFMERRVGEELLTRGENWGRMPTGAICLAGGVRDRHIAPRETLKILVAITGASGAHYAQRLLDNLDPLQHEIHVVLSNYARQVVAEELTGGLHLRDGVRMHGPKSMNVPFASGSNAVDAMVVIPCTMGTLGRIAHGYSEDALLRAADVTLKERKKLILVPRETPVSLVHVKNFELLLLAGATLIPANPSFYTRPQTVEQVVDTVVARVLDHLGVEHQLVTRWQDEPE